MEIFQRPLSLACQEESEECGLKAWKDCRSLDSP